MMNLRVTISDELAEVLISLFTDTVEAASDELDAQIDEDFGRFVNSVTRARQSVYRRRRLQEVSRKAKQFRKQAGAN